MGMKQFALHRPLTRLLRAWALPAGSDTTSSAHLPPRQHQQQLVLKTCYHNAVHLKQSPVVCSSLHNLSGLTQQWSANFSSLPKLSPDSRAHSDASSKQLPDSQKTPDSQPADEAAASEAAASEAAASEASKPQKDTPKSEPSPGLNIFKRFRSAYKEHGKVLVGVHIFTSTIWYGSFYYAAASGVDVVPLLEKFGAGERVTQLFQGAMGNLAVAYLMYKVATPARYPVTIGGTYMAVRLLRRMGYVKTVPQGDSLRDLVKDSRVHVKDRYDDMKVKGKDRYDDMKVKGKDRYDDMKVKGKDRYDDMKVKGKDRYDDMKLKGKGKIEDVRGDVRDKVKEMRTRTGKKS